MRIKKYADPKFEAYYREHIVRDVEALVSAIVASTTALRSIMRGRTRDPRAALAALAEWQANDPIVDLRAGIVVAQVNYGGLAGTPIARALGVRPPTVQRIVDDALAAASDGFPEPDREPARRAVDALVRERDAASTQAFQDSIGPAAKAVIEAVAASTTGLQALLGRPADAPPDPREVLAALAQMQRSQASIDAAVGTYLAWLIVGGIRKKSISDVLGMGPQKLNRLLSPAEHIAKARGRDLVRTDKGWTVARIAE